MRITKLTSGVGIFSLVLLLFTSISFAQAGISFNLPVPMPPMIKDVSDNASSAGTGDVTVTATIITRAAKKPDGTWGRTSELKSAKLYYCTNYASGNPTWTETTMNFTFQSEDTNLHRKIYSATGTIPGQPEGTKVHYYLEAIDDCSDPQLGVGNLMATENPSPAAGPGWALSWKDAKAKRVGENDSPSPGANGPNETQTAYDPTGGIQPTSPLPMVNDLDVLDVLVGFGNPGSGDTFFTKLKVEGEIKNSIGGGSDLSDANAYVVVVSNRKRPFVIDSEDDLEKARGLFALAWCPNISSLLASLMFIDTEATAAYYKQYNEIALKPDDYASALTKNMSGGQLWFKLPMSRFDVTPVTSDPDYESDAFIISAGTANIDASGGLTNIKFKIYDLSTGVNFYLRNHNYTVTQSSGPTEYQVSGSITLSGEGTLTEQQVKDGLKVYKYGQLVTPSQITVTSAGEKKWDYTIKLQPATYTVKVEITGYVVGEVTFNLQNSNLTGQNIDFYDYASGGDLSGDNEIGMEDLTKFVDCFKKEMGESCGGGITADKADLNDDGKVNILDFSILMKNWGK